MDVEDDPTSLPGSPGEAPGGDAIVAAPDALKDRFGLGKPIARGGMGVVYPGTVASTGRACAVKLLDRGLAPEVRKRFLREASMLATVRHPNLVEIYDSGEVEGIPWLAMELVEGSTAKALIAESGPMEPERVCLLAADVAGALDALHAARIIHRDVKPTNLCIDRQGRTVLIDLGVAVDLRRTRDTAVGMLFGTLSYISPEVLMGGPVTPEADWYALGVTLYECLVGKPPWSPAEAIAMAGRGVWEAVPAPPTEPRFQALVDFAMGLMDPDPNARRARRRKVRTEELGILAKSISEHVLATGRAAAVPPRPSNRAARTTRIALGFLGVALFVGGAWQLGSHGDDRTDGPRPPAPDAFAVEEPRDTRITRRLATILPEIDPGSEGDPGLELDRCLDDPALAARALAILARYQGDAELAPVLGYARLEVSRVGDRFDEFLALARETPDQGPVEDTWEASRRILALHARFRHAYMTADPFPPSRLAEALLQAAGNLEQTLAGHREPFAWVARLRHWRSLFELLHAGTAGSLPAYEFFLSLLRPRLSEVATLPIRERVWAVHTLIEGLGFLGDPACLDFAWSEHAEPALDRLASTPALEQHWRARLRKPYERGRELGQASVMATIRVGFRPMSTETWALPLPPDWPGSARTDPRVRVVPDPARPGDIEVPDPSRPPGVEDLVSLGGRARTEGRDVPAHPRILAALEGAPEDAKADLEALASTWPQVVLARTAAARSSGDPVRALDLLRRGEETVRSDSPRIDLDRDGLRGTWLEVRLEAAREELRAGQPDRAVSILQRYLETLADRQGPYSTGELEGAARIWRLAADEIPRAGTCPRIQAEARRLTLAWLEAIPAARPGPGPERERLAGWLARAEGGSDPASPHCQLETRLRPGLAVPDSWIPRAGEGRAARLAALGLAP